MRNANKAKLNGHAPAPADGNVADASAASSQAQQPQHQQRRPARKRLSPYKSRSSSSHLDTADVHMRPASSTADEAPGLSAGKQMDQAFAGLRLPEDHDPRARFPMELKTVDMEKDAGNASFSAGFHADAEKRYQRVRGFHRWAFAG